MNFEKHCSKWLKPNSTYHPQRWIYDKKQFAFYEGVGE